MLSECKRFDANYFLHQLPKWRRRKAKLMQDLENITELPSVNNISGIRSSDISDQTSNLAIKRLEIKKEIESIQESETAYYYAMGKITEQERVLLEGFYNEDTVKSSFVYEYGRKYGLCDTLVYKQRRDALEHFAEVIISEYEL